MKSRLTPAASTVPAHKPKRRLWKRVAGWSAALLLLFLLTVFALLEMIAHRPSPVRMAVTSAEINAEAAHLRQLGLTLPDGSFLKAHPFEPPWTSHSLLVPSTWSEPGLKRLLAPRRVRADLLLADLDVLEPVMQRAYGGWDSAAARGWNWAQWFATWREQLAANGSAEVPFDEAFAPMDRLLAFQRDNHTQIPLNRPTGDGSQTAVLDGAANARCVQIRAGDRTFDLAANDPGQQVRSAKLWRTGERGFAGTHYISMPSSYGVPEAVRCGDAWIPLHPIGERKVGPSAMLHALWAETFSRDHAHFERLGDGIVYVRLPTFVAANYDPAPPEGWPRRQPGDRVLIVDLRDNEGNDADYGLDVLKGWIDETRMVPFDHLGTRIVSSCLYAPLKWNYPISDSKKFKQELLDDMAKPYPPGCPRTVDVRPAQWTYLERHFARGPDDLRIVALVNSRCASDCEGMTLMLASLPQTLVAGANTYGVVQNIQPGYSVLPHTGLQYRIALGRSDYFGDNRSVDGYGLDVDVVLPEVDTLKPRQLRALAEQVASFRN
jgi:hypothetical protein